MTNGWNLKPSGAASTQLKLNLCVFLPTDSDYISEEEKQKVEQMLAFLTEESKQAAASTAVSTSADDVTPHRTSGRLSEWADSK